MNNFVGSYHAAFDKLFEQVKRFSQSILTIAIKSSVPVIVDILLERGLDIARTTCLFANESLTPLGLACKFRRLGVVKTLVKCGVDVNQMELQTQTTAMFHLLGLVYNEQGPGIEFPTQSCEILRLLLNAGAEVGWRELENPHFWTNKPLLGTYLTYATKPTKFDYGYQLHKPLTNAMRLCDQKEATAAINTMLGSRKAMTRLYENNLAERCMEALQHASYQGNESIVEYFMSLGLQPNVRCLCQAVRGKNMRIIQEYIGIRANLDVVEGSDYHTRNLVRRYAGQIPAGAEPLLYKEISIRYGRTTPFAEPIRWGHSELVVMFENMDILETITESERFSAAIFAASEAGNVMMVERLLERTRNMPELITPALPPSVSIATLGNHQNIVLMLMSAGIKPVASCVTMAILIRNVYLIELFLDVAVSIVDTFGLLYLAVRWGNTDMIARLIDADALLNESGCDLGIVELEDPNIADRSPLGEAIYREDDEELLSVAIERGKERLVRELLVRGADPNDPVAISSATIHSADMTSLILGAFCQRKMYSASSALRQAIKDESEEIVRLLANHTDLNEKDKRSENIAKWPGTADGGRLRVFLPTPLGEAILTGNARLVRILLDSGADPTKPGGGQAAASRITHTPLQLAVETGQRDIIDFLIEHGADVNSVPCLWARGTALQIAANRGFVGIADMLLERGASVNAPGSTFHGRTAFEGAAENGRMDMLLLLYHKDVDMIFDGGAQVQRAMHLAEKNGQLAARDLVRELAESAQLLTVMAF
ncbi:ankyrin [Setomelanomma holmii]|uniref:Ankyrin n=1 Tax=Setomelanomma holmii TaxID=210430 RepID=A0A9P4HAS4_9PLEO|nr:ankyrin [Setomelanomma holmii]